MENNRKQTQTFLLQLLNHTRHRASHYPFISLSRLISAILYDITN